VKQEQFLDVLSVDEARERWHRALALEPLAEEVVPLAEALGRVLARDVRAPGDVPAFDRSDVDGFAVHAEDTFGASEREPAVLRVARETADAGHAPTMPLARGEALAIATGGVLPRGADAVVMVEDTDLAGDGRVRVVRPTVPGQRISAAGSDVARGETVLRRGDVLTARETGTLAACGIDRVPCVGRLRVAVISTGDEIVPPGTPLAHGQVHDANATLVADAVRELGGEAQVLGVARDDGAALRAMLRRAREAFHATILSGGTSKGGGDLSHRVLAESAAILVHGVALKPGKPLCLASWDRKPVAVLPGFPTSAIFTFHAFVAPVLRCLMGAHEAPRGRLRARLPRRMTSERGRTEFTLVSLVHGREGLCAFPLGKGSGSVTAFARADGFFEVPANVEAMDAGDEVEVTLLGRDVKPADLVVVGSHCTGLDVLLSAVTAQGLTTKVLSVGSRGGVEAAAEGACHVAPVHLLEPATGRWNAPFAPPGARFLEGYGRRQGLAFRRDQAPAFGAGSVEDAFLRAARDPGLRLANRNPASGTRVLVDELLRRAPDARPPGASTTYRSHTAVAAAIAQGRADYGICLEQSARAAGLSFRAWRSEHFDFLVPADRWDEPGTRAFRAALADPAVRSRLRDEGFEA
jgi:putative molybdopterin biosynthesis protein